MPFISSSTPSSADGVWHGLCLVPALVVADVPVPDGAKAAVVVQQGQVAWVGPEGAVPAAYATLPRHDGQGALATPGLVDCHTHLVYGGRRANEFAMRLAGASYEEVARAGGGIVSSVRATREASEDGLFALALPRLQALLDEGVCAIEIKSGYGLALAHERKQLRVARRLGETTGTTVRTTFLGAHALPPEYAGRSQDYIDLVCQEMLPALAAEGLVDAVDVFCERIAFSLAETEQVFQAAQHLNIPVKLHAEQLSDMGGQHWRRVLVRSRATTLNICPPTVLLPCGRRARWLCCCPGPTTRCATLICRPLPSCVRPVCRWRYRPTITLALLPHSACC